MAASQIPAVPKSRMSSGDFWGSVRDDDLIYFALNVGDADSQVLLLPVMGNRRPVVVVDAGTSNKVRRFLKSLPAQSGGLIPEVELIDIVVASHPHSDHISGMPDLLDTYPGKIAEFWDPGYFHPSGTYFAVMERLAQETGTVYVQPTSGMRRFVGNTEITVLTPSVALRNRYDTYGIDVNNASISLRVATPAGRTKFVPDQSWQLLDGVTEAVQFSLILGADAQTESWSHAMADFPQLVKSNSDIAKAIGAATANRDFLRADVLKVSHHGSKKGVNYELVARIKPKFMVMSCSATSGHGFPHTLNQHILREAKLPLAKKGQDHKPEEDHLLGVFYTSQKDSGGDNLGSMAFVGRNSSTIEMWRLGDTPAQLPDFSQARRWNP